LRTTRNDPIYFLASRAELTLPPTCLPGQGGTPTGGCGQSGNQTGQSATCVSFWFNRELEAKP